MRVFDLETLLKLVWSLGSGEAGDRDRLRRDQDEKDRLTRDVEEWLEEHGERYSF